MGTFPIYISGVSEVFVNFVFCLGLGVNCIAPHFEKKTASDRHTLPRSTLARAQSSCGFFPLSLRRRCLYLPALVAVKFTPREGGFIASCPTLCALQHFILNYCQFRANHRIQRGTIKASLTLQFPISPRDVYL